MRCQPSSSYRLNGTTNIDSKVEIRTIRAKLNIILQNENPVFYGLANWFAHRVVKETVIPFIQNVNECQSLHSAI